MDSFKVLLGSFLPYTHQFITETAHLPIFLVFQLIFKIHF